MDIKGEGYSREGGVAHIHIYMYTYITHKLVRKSVPPSLYIQICTYEPVHTSPYIQICRYRPVHMSLYM